MKVLNNKNLELYKSQIALQGFGLEGQYKLLKSKILIIGVGGLGSPAIMYLAAAGIGTIGIADNDTVEYSNIQRQIIHSTFDINKLKIKSAKDKIKKINPNIKVNTYKKRITSKNITKIIQNYDFVIDCTDNLPSKFLINDACVYSEKPFSHGGVSGFEGQTITYTPDNACYRCIFQSPPEEENTSSENAILGPVAGVIGCIQATEAIKFILNKKELLTNQLLVFDSINMSCRKISIKRNIKCSVCKTVIF